MRLLIFTQKVDKNDSVLGFFHTWITEFSKICDSVEVICLEKGNFNLPKNVTVYSLGKETGVSKIGYIVNLYKYLHLINGSYDKVFIHMNQEYVLLSGLYWKIKRIPVYLWRNHPQGTILTRLAVFLSTKVFCVSSGAFTVRFDKTVIMPAGINTTVYKPTSGAIRKKYSVCMVGRISPIKHIELGLQAVGILLSQGVQVSLDIVGPIPDRDFRYFDSLKKYLNDKNLGTSIRFLDSVVPDKLPEVYSSYEICLNLTDSGSFDKTVVEASACGTIPLVSNTSFSHLLPEECLTTSRPEDIAESIKHLLDPQVQIRIQESLEKFAESQSLAELIKRLDEELK